MNDINRCASQSCRFCSLVLIYANWNGDEGNHHQQAFVQMASWGDRFAIDLVNYGDGYTILVMWPYESQRSLNGVNAEPLDYEGIAFMSDLKLVDDAVSSHSYEISSNSTSSEATFQKIRTWMKICESHPSCVRWPAMIGVSATLPSRLLELRAGAESPKVRLVLQHELSHDSCRYATLSHCWGGMLPIRLLQQNVESFRADISWHALPLTFQETVAATLRLGITYIWIDSLCIIQDSKDDWIHESSKMGDVYANCCLNISANESESGVGGLFRQRDPKLHGSFIVTGPKSDTQFRACCYTERLYYEAESPQYVPLRRRAWVVQERFLSPRVVHFSRSQVHWECTELMTSENVPASLDQFPTRLSTERKSALCSQIPHHRVQKIKEKLSFPLDRPVAIAGLARMFCPLLGLKASDYNCGLWRPRFVQDLVWGARSPKTRVDTDTPSWSWLSVDTKASWYSEKEWRPIAKIIEVNTLPRNDPFGAVLSGHAQLRGPLCSITISESLAYLEGDNCLAIRIGKTVMKKFVDFFYCLDEQESFSFDYGPEKIVYFFLVGGEDTEIAVNSRFRLKNYDCLILVPAANPGSFRRIGLWRFYPPGGDGSKTWETVELIDKHFRSQTVPSHLYEKVTKDFMYTITLV
ncbi:uncharacterized protein PAC_18596 [Phialocephala subalpina]|uniref:Heterokaryon incompatibility domain-containing protein n=1 Tax=Phialocephala subalpina TaxID=576137 RepID=A0A1L7XUP0_9HELO|nr:uncharacterized protein PAC_18596 [Phialocephala subalpina]